MKYLARCLHAMERDPEEWGDTADSAKKNISNNTHGRFTNNGIPHVSTNLAVTTVETVTTAKPNNPPYNYSVAGRPNYNQFTCGFCHDVGHVMWRCERYLALNLNTRGRIYQEQRPLHELLVTPYY